MSAIEARARQIAAADFEAPGSAWARRSVRPSDPQWTREAIIRRYFWWPAMAQAEREAREAASDLPATIFGRLADAEARLFAAGMTDDPGRWEAEHGPARTELTQAQQAASKWRAANINQAAE